eukprot:jgi/Phyca11/21986/fgenesh1_pg.PHYCAscaffold_331_\
MGAGKSYKAPATSSPPATPAATAGKSYKAPATSSPPATPAATAGTKDSELVKQIAALIVPEMTSSAEERLKKNAQREFWTEMRERLSGTPPAKIPSPSKPQKKKKKKKSPTKEAATADLLALGQGKPSPKGAKPVTPPTTLGKRKQSSKSDDESKLKIPKPTPTPTPETDYCPYVMTDSTPPSLLQDVEGIYRRAYNMGKTCQALAYPWEGSKVWYDPVENELLHVAHWRFWMANRG